MCVVFAYLLYFRFLKRIRLSREKSPSSQQIVKFTFWHFVFKMAPIYILLTNSIFPGFFITLSFSLFFFLLKSEYKKSCAIISLASYVDSKVADFCTVGFFVACFPKIKQEKHNVDGTCNQVFLLWERGILNKNKLFVSIFDHLKQLLLPAKNNFFLFRSLIILMAMNKTLKQGIWE